MVDTSNNVETLIETLRNEIPRIIGNSNGETLNKENLNNEYMNEMVSIIESLEKGEEPILLKIVSGNASNDEISQWALSNNISPSDTNDTISMLISSFNTGTQIAEKIETELSEQTNNLNEIIETLNNSHQTSEQLFEKSEEQSEHFEQSEQTETIHDRLDNILYQLETIKKEVMDLINIL